MALIGRSTDDDALDEVGRIDSKKSTSKQRLYLTYRGLIICIKKSECISTEHSRSFYTQLEQMKSVKQSNEQRLNKRFTNRKSCTVLLIYINLYPFNLYAISIYCQSVITNNFMSRFLLTTSNQLSDC